MEKKRKVKGRRPKHTQIFWRRVPIEASNIGFKLLDDDKTYCCKDFEIFGMPYHIRIDWHSDQKNLMFFLRRHEMTDPRCEIWHCPFCGKKLELIETD